MLTLICFKYDSEMRILFVENLKKCFGFFSQASAIPMITAPLLLAQSCSAICPSITISLDQVLL